jgi:hypothetical protein
MAWAAGEGVRGMVVHGSSSNDGKVRASIPIIVLGSSASPKTHAMRVHDIIKVKQSYALYDAGLSTGYGSDRFCQTAHRVTGAITRWVPTPRVSFPNSCLTHFSFTHRFSCPEVN